MSDAATNTARNKTARGQRARILLMSPEDRRRKAAEILATGLIKLVHATGTDASDEEVGHGQR